MGLTRLSVNINKFATLRNSRGGNNPDIIRAALDAEKFGAQGITVHPRPDERHIRQSDVHALKKVLSSEFNIEGNPMEKRFMDLVLDIKPRQVTLVPDSRTSLTSNQGWNTVENAHYLKEIIAAFKEAKIRTSLFVDPVTEMVHGAKDVGADRIELYTEAYARQFPKNPKAAIAPYLEAAALAQAIGLGLNAGHDLNLENLRFFQENIPNLLEVSIGHALVCDALYMGFEATVKAYLACLS